VVAFGGGDPCNYTECAFYGEKARVRTVHRQSMVETPQSLPRSWGDFRHRFGTILAPFWHSETAVNECDNGSQASKDARPPRAGRRAPDGSLLSDFQFTVSYKRTDTDSSSILSGRGYRFTRHRSAWKFKCLCDVWTTSADDCDLTTWNVYLYSG
jgi:hypothetical protein